MVGTERNRKDGIEFLCKMSPRGGSPSLLNLTLLARFRVSSGFMVMTGKQVLTISFVILVPTCYYFS